MFEEIRQVNTFKDIIYIMEEEKSLSVLAAFDELVRNTSVLTDGSEAEFLTYVGNSEVSRQRWEHAELECQRLSIELTKCSQDITNLEQKLKHARLMLDTELHLRKRAEAERDKLANQLQFLKQLVMDTDNCGMDEVTINKIRGLDVCGGRAHANIFSPGTNEALNGRISAMNQTEASVLDVDDLSFDIDDTADLCESRTRAGTNFKVEKDETLGRRKRSRSASKKGTLPFVVENASKKGRRSCSLGGNVVDEMEKAARQKPRRSSALSEGMGRRSTVNSRLRPTTSGKENKKQYEDGDKDHEIVDDTVIKPRKCGACFKRLKYGKLCLKCLHCKERFHIECRESLGTCHASSPTKVSTIPFPSLTTPNKRNSTYLTPNKKDTKSTIFASPMLR